MRFDFQGLRVVVCGASQGIGLAIAEGFAQAGAAVAICARGAERLERARARIAALGVPVHAATCDLADRAAAEGFVIGAAAALGGLDVLVNNASGGLPMGSEAAWATNLAIDLLGTSRTVRPALPWLVQKRGSVINLSSISAVRHSIWHASYTPVKAALNAYTASLAARLAPDGVRVNAIAPGPVEFPGSVWDGVRRDNPELYRKIIDRSPFGRMGSPAEIADVVLFLASPAARWMTGQVLTADGGQSLGA
jgi:3-oxoacyl-[acyl-carrier protein] reductase